MLQLLGFDKNSKQKGLTLLELVAVAIIQQNL
jgi:hypothetical protein